MVIFLRCNEVIYDSRAMKYLKYFNDNKIDYKIVGWNRQGNIKDVPEGSIYYQRRAGYNVGGMRAVLNRIFWMFFLVRTLVKIGKKNDVIHACDLDCAFPAAVYKFLFRRHPKIIFDVFDWYSSMMSNQKKFILWAFKRMERFSTNHSDHIIICEPERIVQIPYKIPDEKLSVLPNIPYFDDDSFLVPCDKYRFDNDKITFAYVGSITLERYIDEVITLAEKGLINLNIAGYGDQGIESRLHSLSDCPNIRYYGKVDYKDALTIMYNSGIIYAMYATISPNNVYAAPNKYYEAMFLGKALFTNSGTIVEQKVRKFDTGYIADENYESIKDIATNIDMQVSAQMGASAHKLWEEKYNNYTRDYLTNVYSNMIKC